MADIKVDKFKVTIPEGSLSHKIECELLPFTEEMNRTPLVVNRDTWKKNHEAQSIITTAAIAKCREECGWVGFRPNANSDCVKVFFEQRKHPVQRTSSKTGAITCDKEVLATLEAKGDMLATYVMIAREEMHKMSQLEKWAFEARDGQVQAQWNQLGQPMGRYTADSPNLLNRITEVRETIEARPGYKFISCDLGQAEYVGWASLSKDPLLSETFNKGEDLHVRMIQEVMALVPNFDLHGQPPRDAGKTINFALLYLMKKFALAQKLKCTDEIAEAIIKAWEERAATAVQYRRALLKECKTTCKVSTFFGRVKDIPEIKIAGGHLLHEIEKTAWHHHNCGTAAELLKIKQIKVMKALRKAGYEYDDARAAIQFYDELILEVKDEKVEAVKAIMLEKFHEEIKGFLPFKVDCRVGQNWLQISK